MCLVLVGLFFAYKLYQRNLITLGDYYRQRFGRGVEVICSLVIILSYLGWVAAQITALGLVFHVLTAGRDLGHRRHDRSAPSSCWSTRCSAACGRWP